MWLPNRPNFSSEKDLEKILEIMPECSLEHLATLWRIHHFQNRKVDMDHTLFLYGVLQWCFWPDFAMNREEVEGLLYPCDYSHTREIVWFYTTPQRQKWAGLKENPVLLHLKRDAIVNVRPAEELDLWHSVNNEVPETGDSYWRFHRDQFDTEGIMLLSRCAQDAVECAFSYYWERHPEIFIGTDDPTSEGYDDFWKNPEDYIEIDNIALEQSYMQLYEVI